MLLAKEEILGITEEEDFIELTCAGILGGADHDVIDGRNCIYAVDYF